MKKIPPITPDCSSRPDSIELARRNRLAQKDAAPDALATHQEFYRRRELYSNTEAIELVMQENCLDRDRAVDVVATVMENFEVFFGRVARADHDGEKSNSSNNGGYGTHHSNTATLKEDFQILREQIEVSVANKQRYVKKHGDPVMAEACMWLHLGFPLLAGAADQASLVKLLGREKQTVNKCLLYFQAETPKLPILDGQRDKKARNNFVIAREEQLPPVDLRLKEKLTEKA